MTISDFVSLLSGRIQDNRLDLILRLYDCYSSLSQNEEKHDFDRFRSWGETVISDFNEIDMQLVDPDEIFKNIKDFREISSNFLTDDQRALMMEYFGYKGPDVSPEKFWRNFEDDEVSTSKSKFLYLWRVLTPLYHSLHDSLDKDLLTTTGGMYRLACKHVEARYNDLRNGKLPEKSSLDRYDKLVFVGFNALSRAEFRLFSYLKKLRSSHPQHPDEEYADFIWDASGPLFEGEDNPASNFIKINRKFFPSPKWSIPFISQSDATTLPDLINVDATPSNVAQLKIISSKLETLIKSVVSQETATTEGDKKSHADDNGSNLDIEFAKLLKSARIAIVLPDESLLQPLLYSLPESVPTVNLTMGYPLKQTATVSYMTLLRRMQARRRKNMDGVYGFFYDDLKAFLSHPYCQAIFGSKNILLFNSEISKNHHFVITYEDTIHLGEEARRLLHPFAEDITNEETLVYMEDALEIASRHLDDEAGLQLHTKIEHQNISIYRDAIHRLAHAVGKYDIKINYTTLFGMADRLIAGETVSFEGEPLTGLQVMGMLETRALDFDYLFIPSLNDKIMPRKARNRTFIPNSLRRAYGMPPANYQENLFSYYFFRLLSRAKNVWITYDSRTGDNGGGISRYLLQLKHILAPKNIVFNDCVFRLSSAEANTRTVKKNGEIAEKIGQYLVEGSKRNLSASALQQYIECPMRFFYEKILDIRTDDDPGESIDPATTGNIVHGTMMHLYMPEELHKKFVTSPITITKEYITELLSDNKKIERLVIRMVNKEHFHLEKRDWDRPLRGSAALTLDGMVQMVRNILKYDLKQAPFLVYGCETSKVLRYPLYSGKLVNMNFAIDRIDRRSMDKNEPLRIVDYKTGRVMLQADSMDDLFDNGTGKNIFQLYLYANLLDFYLKTEYPQEYDKFPEDIKLEIYNVPNILEATARVPTFKEDNKKVKHESHISQNEQFLERLNILLEDLMDPEKPFEQTKDISHCKYCNLKNLCNLTI